MNLLHDRPYLAPFSKPLILKLTEALRQADAVAYYNVTHDNNARSILDETGRPKKGHFARGGPFGALLALTLEDGTFEYIGEKRGNNVVGSGIASRHAEDQALQPDNYEALVTRLTDMRVRGKNPFVWLVSSGQSCINCHAKQEIMARDLEKRELLLPGHFVNLYGATYDDTFKIAQFYDAQYADALILFSRQPEHPGNLIRHETKPLQEQPAEIQDIFKSATGPTAVVMRDGKPYAVGRDTRSSFDPFTTAEVNAVREACSRHRFDDNVFASWKINGTLLTTNRQVGPNLFAETAWTEIDKIVTVAMPRGLKHKQFETEESRGTGNTNLLNVMELGYKNPLSSLRVTRDGDYTNTAQPKWAEMLAVNGEQLYNGAAVSSDVQRMRDLFTRDRYAAPDLRCYEKDMPKRPIVPLDALIPDAIPL